MLRRQGAGDELFNEKVSFECRLKPRVRTWRVGTWLGDRSKFYAEEKPMAQVSGTFPELYTKRTPKKGTKKPKKG